MTVLKTSIGRRSFLKASTLAGGGMMLSFSWLAGCTPDNQTAETLPKEWFDINGFLKIADNGKVTIMSPNPEIGQNVKTSMPMIIAEELDVDWQDVEVEQAKLNTDIFTRQLAGGSQSIRQGWESLRMAGASARKMLCEAAAQAWNVPANEISTRGGKILHSASNQSAGYGEFASAAAQVKVPEEVELKEVKDFKIIGTSRKNVDAKKIVSGQPLYGLDYRKEGMLIAMIVHPPAFGMKLKSVDDSKARSMPGIKDVFTINTFKDDYDKHAFDAAAFTELIVVVGNTTWEVMNAKKALEVAWEPIASYTETFSHYADKDRKWNVSVPEGLENSNEHQAQMAQAGEKLAKVVRKDGDPEAAFRNAAQIVERSYSAPFLAHNTMEPMNFFAHVTDEHAELVGPIQTPEHMEKSVAAQLDLPLEKIDIQMTRMGGGFGRRLYGHFLVEAAVISKKMKAPIKLVYSREDDMTFGNYRPSYYATYRAALDENKKLIGFHVRAGGVPESPLFANRFPAGSIDNYLAEEWSLESNISIGAFRAPRSNFIAGAEQSFMDELAEAMGKDPIEFRLELLDRAKNNPVGQNNDYDADRYAGVLELVREKSSWNQPQDGVYRGVSAYFCHNSYVAQVLDMVIENDKPVVEKVHCAIDCGIVVNPIAATNLTEGGIVDGIGHSMYSALTFRDGAPEKSNFDTYRLIRHSEAPKSIDVHFVQNNIDPTGLGEPPYPPIVGALANALYKATGNRYYHQPFVSNEFQLG
ncbi:molybdopterin-dependent oxidoreductase [Porifericola rhodea]|uniref:xanthine dehydrogenase family protein molybdopterin-binding subunit n=1 Tax=Porifericola rhodea TaxID=930972 RepID=UPI00266668B9|nr:molybdopterin cofactor-binding domain-containing protein [Porifericola rhodea]WKN30303.1 molybdopterin-dependent oxidoreductase [Porifericola rhodea]